MGVAKVRIVRIKGGFMEFTDLYAYVSVQEAGSHKTVAKRRRRGFSEQRLLAWGSEQLRGYKND